MRSASKASVMAMSPYSGFLPHGGDLSTARAQFPQAPEPFIDLSTGINPNPYPLPELPSGLFAQLPQRSALERLIAAAARFYKASSADHVVAAPGTQILLTATTALLPRGRAAVLGPTYSEHVRVAALAGHDTKQVSELDDLAGADLAIVVNPNNPDGRIVPPAALLAIAAKLRSHGGLLMVDEAFVEVAPAGTSLAGEVDRGNIVVLRSFGKFFGLAGLRLGFALAAPAITARIAAWLGPWAVSGPAVAVGEAALADAAWAQSTRERLCRDAQRLDELLSQSGLEVIGGTPLFRLSRCPAAKELFEHLGRAGILVRRFPENPTWLRFGLPADKASWKRLRTAVQAFVV
jgi:cobalamin biosynthetic protein CobC